jgi:hypothetical protein
MQYIVTDIELQQLANIFHVQETCMRLLINHINSYGSDIECSLYAEIEYCLEHPHTILDITRNPSYAHSQSTTSSDQATNAN